jgi:hypothetical protein
LEPDKAKYALFNAQIIQLAMGQVNMEPVKQKVFLTDQDAVRWRNASFTRTIAGCAR